jgi:hypothetical protein
MLRRFDGNEEGFVIVVARVPLKKFAADLS